jgi:hypothetical protein
MRSGTHSTTSIQTLHLTLQVLLSLLPSGRFSLLDDVQEIVAVEGEHKTGLLGGW